MDTASTTFLLVIIASHLPSAVMYRRWPSFSGCCDFVSGTVYHSTSHLCSHCQFSSHLKTYLFRCCFPWLCYCASEV